jgi:hypothetical protein
MNFSLGRRSIDRDLNLGIQNAKQDTPCSSVDKCENFGVIFWLQFRCMPPPPHFIKKMETANLCRLTYKTILRHAEDSELYADHCENIRSGTNKAIETLKSFFSTPLKIADNLDEPLSYASVCQLEHGAM